MKYPMLITRVDTDVPIKHVEPVVDYVGIALSPGLVDRLAEYSAFFQDGLARDGRLREMVWEDTILPAVWFCGREVENCEYFDLEELLTEDELAEFEDNDWIIAEVRRTQIPSKAQLWEIEDHVVIVDRCGIQWRCVDTQTGMNLYSRPVALGPLEEACKQQ